VRVTNSGQSSRGPDPGRQAEPRSGAPLFTFDASQRIRSWNRAAEELTGLDASEIVGRYCWEALCAHDEDGGLVCHPGCSFHRLLSEHWPVSPPTLVIRTATGTRRVKVPMVVLDDRELFAGLMIDVGEAEREPAGDPGTPPSLTPRQQTVLGMLVDGKPARAIAAELQLSEMTVRNHIRAILRALGCTSQLAAVAKARRLRLDLPDADRREQLEA